MTTGTFPFLQLPLELREAIYSLYFKPADRLVQNHTLEVQSFFGGVYEFDVGLWRVNRQIYREARAVWRRENVFVKIATPWPSAGMYRVYLMATDGRESPDFGAGGRLNHISSEGLVPIVCTDTHSDRFTTHHALVQITAPFHQAVPEHTIVVLLDDLPLFTQTWYYSALSYPMLNDRLSTTFVLRDPYASQTSKPQDVNLALQRRLLLPFEQVKGLHHIDITGYAPSVQAELKRRMAIPIPTLVECCEKATDLLLEGDAAIAAHRPAKALTRYKESFHAIHILIHKRTRRVLGDVFFHEGIETGRYAGQTGMTVRVVLRLKLVSRYMLAYMKLENWGEAAFWGMRSMRIMRDAMDTEFEDYISDLVGGLDVALIYVRAACAFWKMECEYAHNGEQSTWRDELAIYDGEEMAGSERIWGLATKYLKGKDKAGVRKELAEFGATRDIVALFVDDGGLENMSIAGQDGSGDEEIDEDLGVQGFS